MMKLNTLLGKTDYLSASFNNMLKDYIGFFKNKQGAFIGEKRTYTPREGTVEEAGKKKNVLVQTTVAEKLEWLLDNSKDYVDALFSVEKTNSNGNARAELMVDGTSWGTFTSLELLRLKSFVENNDLKGVFENIPVRSDSQEWEKNTAEQYEGRAIWQTPLSMGVEKTTLKTSYILPDPNIDKLGTKAYTPQVSQTNTVVELGDYTHQVFSGEMSQREKAEILKKRKNLLVGIIEALKDCNDVEVEKSELTSERIFKYLLG